MLTTRVFFRTIQRTIRFLNTTEKKSKEYVRKWEQLVYGEVNTEIDVYRSINAGASVISILQFFTSNNQQLSLSQYTSLMDLIADQTPFQVNAYRRVKNDIDNNQGTDAIKNLLTLYKMSRKIKHDTNFIQAAINLVTAQFFTQLGELQKQLSIHNMITSRKINDQIVQAYCNYMKQSEMPQGMSPASEIQWCYYRIANAAYLEKLLTTQKLQTYFSIEKYEQVVNRYFDLIDSDQNRLELLSNNLNENVMIYRLPYTHQAVITRSIKEKLSNIWLKITNWQQNMGVYIYRSDIFNIQLASFLFTTGDRFLVLPFLTTYLEYLCKAKNGNRMTLYTLALMNRYHIQNRAYLYMCLVGLKEKFEILEKIKFSRTRETIVVFIQQLYFISQLFQLNIIGMINEDTSELIIGQAEALYNKYCQNFQAFIDKPLEFQNLEMYFQAEAPEQELFNIYDPYTEGGPKHVSLSKVFKKLKMDHTKEDLRSVFVKSQSDVRNALFKDMQKMKYKNLALQNTPCVLVRLLSIISSYTMIKLVPSEKIVKRLDDILSNPAVTKLIVDNICYPGLLDILLLIHYYSQIKQIKILSPEIDELILDHQKKFTSVLSDLKETLLNSNNMNKDRGGYYLPYLHNSLSKDSYQNPLYIEYGVQNDDKNIIKQYSSSPTNIVRNILDNPYCNYIIQNSELKKIVEKTLVKMEAKLTKNVISYPFYCDFLVETSQSRVAIFVLDFSKCYAAGDMVPQKRIAESIDYYMRSGCKIVKIDYRDYTIQDHAQKIKNKLTASIF